MQPYIMRRNFFQNYFNYEKPFKPFKGSVFNIQDKTICILKNKYFFLKFVKK